MDKICLIWYICSGVWGCDYEHRKVACFENRTVCEKEQIKQDGKYRGIFFCMPEDMSKEFTTK